MADNPLSSGAEILVGADAISAFLFGQPNRRRVYHLISRGLIPTFKLGEHVVARKASLVEHLARLEAVANGEAV